VVNCNNLDAGDLLTVDVTVQPISQPFDAYGVVITQNQQIYSFSLTDTNALYPGVRPLIKGVPFLPSVFSRRLYQGTLVLPVTYGMQQIIVGLVPAGTQPVGTQSAIPCYVDQESVTVNP